MKDLMQMQAETKPNISALERWLRKHAFSSWLNAFGALIVFALVALVLTNSLNYLFRTADWEAIAPSLKLLALYNYPIDLVWRPFSVLSLLCLLLGLLGGALSTSRYWNSAQPMFYGLTGLVVVFASFSLSLFPSVRWYWFAALSCTVLGSIIGKWFPKMTRQSLIPVSLVIYAVASILLFGLSFYSTGPLRFVGPALWGGALLSFYLTLTAFLLSFPMGIALSLGSQSKLPIIRSCCKAFIVMVKAVPFVVWLLAAHVIMVRITPNFLVEDMITAQLSLLLFATVYFADIVNQGLKTLPNAQEDAAKSLGLNRFERQAIILWPQILKRKLADLIELLGLIFRATSVVLIIGLLDFFALAINLRTALSSQLFWGSESVEVFIVIAAFYGFFCYLISLTVKRLRQDSSTKPSETRQV